MKISNKVKVAACSLAMVACGAMSVAPAFATDGEYSTTGAGTAVTQYTGAAADSAGLSRTKLDSTVNTVINIAIGIIGLLAVIMIIVGGFQYTTSAGDSGKVTKAKNTIMYGVIGLVIALLAYAIVNFVLGNVFK